MATGAELEVAVFADLSWAKLAVLLLVGLFVFGPERLPGIAADAGRLLRKLRAMADGMTEDLKAELGPELGDLDLASLHPRRFIQEHLFGPDEPAPTPVGTPSVQAVLPAGARAPYDPEAT